MKTTRRQAVLSLLAPALAGAAPQIYPSAAEQEAIVADLTLAARASGSFRPIPGDVADRLALHCARLLREVRRRDDLGLR